MEIEILQGLNQQERKVLPCFNPYLKVPEGILNNIGKNRNIVLCGSFEEKAQQLYQYDHLNPDWIQNIIGTNINKIYKLPIEKLYLYGALQQLDLRDITLRRKILAEYIIFHLVIKQENSKLFHDLFVTIEHETLEAISKRLNIPYHYLIFSELHEIILAVKTNNYDHIVNNPERKQQVERFFLITTSKYITLLGRLYHIRPFDENSWIKLIRLKRISPLESIILSLDNLSDEEIINALGILVPPSYQGQERLYIEENILLYELVLSRGNFCLLPLSKVQRMKELELDEYISRLKDREIQRIFGIIHPYNSRLQLVNNVIRSIQQKTFFIPFERSYEKSRNHTTYFMNYDITDTSFTAICFGTIIRHYTYDIEDLVYSFYMDPETGEIRARKPHNIRKTFKKEQLESLLELLQELNPTEQVNTLIQRINNVFIFQEDRLASDEIIKNVFRIFDENQKQVIKDFLYQLFYTGMFMRRWPGPGHPYPLETRATLVNINPNDNVYRELVKLDEIINRMDDLVKIFCLEQLNTCEYDNGKIRLIQRKIYQEIIDVGYRDHCIRVSSNRFIGTGFHYVRTLFKEIIPGVNIREIEVIC